jgi:hypothetical protein
MKIDRHRSQDFFVVRCSAVVVVGALSPDAGSEVVFVRELPGQRQWCLREVSLRRQRQKQTLS